MPNIVTMQTLYEARAILRDALYVHAVRTPDTAQRDQLAYSHAVAVSRSQLPTSYRFSAHEVVERTEVDKPAHRDYAPNKSDTDVKLAQYLRLAGIKGTAVLSRMDLHCGAKGKSPMHTANASKNDAGGIVAADVSGVCPSEIRAVAMPSDGSGFTITGSEVRFLERYRGTMKGETFAQSMERERMEREHAVWRAMFPYLPTDRSGKLVHGKRYNRPDGIGERVFNDGTLMTERRRAWQGANPDASLARGMPDNRKALQREIDALVAEQRKDMDDDRRHSMRVSMRDLSDEDTSRTRPVRFD